MANTTLTVAANSNVAEKLNVLSSGVDIGAVGASLKAFTATAGTGNYPLLGLTLDLSGLFPNKVYAVILSPLYDPALTTGDLAYLAVYVPSATGAPNGGKVYVYDEAGVMTADDAVAITGYIISGFAIGY